MRATLARPDRRLWIVLAAGRPVGALRLDLAGRRGEVSIHLAPGARGRGLGTAALRALEPLARDDLGVNRLTASVKADNPASLGAFARAGYAPVPARQDGAVLHLRRQVPRGARP
jgi:RimJ/RimL family protein N-acetyltransferase